jgi:hypothetical protein
VHHERQPERGEDRHRLAQIALADVRKLVDARRHEEALERSDAGLGELAQVSRVAGHDTADEADVDPRAAGRCLPLRLERGRRCRRRDAVERHVEERRDTAGRGGARGGLEAFPLGASGLVHVDVRVHEPRENDEVARVDEGPFGNVRDVADTGDLAMLHMDGGRREPSGREYSPRANRDRRHAALTILRLPIVWGVLLARSTAAHRREWRTIRLYPPRTAATGCLRRSADTPPSSERRRWA